MDSYVEAVESILTTDLGTSDGYLIASTGAIKFSKIPVANLPAPLASVDYLRGSSGWTTRCRKLIGKVSNTELSDQLNVTKCEELLSAATKLVERSSLA